MKSKNLILLLLLATLVVCTAFASFANAVDETVISMATAPSVPPESEDGESSIEPFRPDKLIHEDMDTTFSETDEPNLISTNTAGTNSVADISSDSPKTLLPPSETTETDEKTSTELPIHPDMDTAYTAQNDDARIAANGESVGDQQEVNLISDRNQAGVENVWVVLGIMAVLTAGSSSVLGVVLYRRVPIKK